MGSVNKTPFLSLSQFEDTDKPSWRGDYNSDMRKLEASAVKSENDSNSALTAANNAVASAQAANNTANGLISRVDTAEANADAARNAAAAATGTANEASGTANTALAAVAGLDDFALAAKVENGNNPLSAATSALAVSTKFAGKVYGGNLAAFRAAIANPASNYRVVGIGSSTIGGAFVNIDGEKFFHRLAHRAGANIVENLVGAGSASGMRWLTGAAGGLTASDYLGATRLNAITSVNANMILHMVGSNDFANGVSVSTYKSQLAAAVQSIENALPNSVNVLIHSQRRFDTSATNWAEFGAAMREVADGGANRIFIDTMEYLDGFGSVPGNTWGMLVDNIHFGHIGHYFLAEIIGAHLGIPSESAIGFGARSMPQFSLPASTTYVGTAGAVRNTYLSHIDLSPVPYPRKVTYEGTVYVGDVAGEAQFNIGRFANPSDAELDIVAMRIRPGTGSTAVPFNMPFILPPNLAGRYQIRVQMPAGTNNSVYISGNSAFSRLYLNVEPY